MFSLKNTARATALAVVFVGGVAQAQGTPTDMTDKVPLVMEHMSLTDVKEHHHGMVKPWKHVEGDIAFIRAELKIDEAQSAPWNAFAEVLRTSAKAMDDLLAKEKSATAPVDVPQFFDQHEKMLAGYLDLLHSVHAAATPLYAVLNDKQKQMADHLIKEMCAR